MIRRIAKQPPARRGGYALVLVLMFTTLLLSAYAVSHRYLSASLGSARARALRQDRDEGSLTAVAQGLYLLETGLPPADPYVCQTVLETPRGSQTYALTFQTLGLNQWSVEAVPADPGVALPPLPDSF